MSTRLGACECSGCPGCSHPVPSDPAIGFCDRRNTTARWHTKHDNAFPLCPECYQERKGRDVEDDDAVDVSPTCHECAGACFTTPVGVTHHGTPDAIDHDADADHVALPDRIEP